MLRLDWTIRDTYLHKDFMIPANLNWSGGNRIVPLTICKGYHIVPQRHHALAWLTNGMDGTQWDGIPT